MTQLCSGEAEAAPAFQQHAAHWPCLQDVVRHTFFCNRAGGAFNLKEKKRKRKMHKAALQTGRILFEYMIRLFHCVLFGTTNRFKINA